jgi:hypothetical protein
VASPESRDARPTKWSVRGIRGLADLRNTQLDNAKYMQFAITNWVFHELRCYNAYAGCFANFSFWRLSSGIEILGVRDFLSELWGGDLF